MKVFFDVDGVLIDGWHANPARRKAWDTTIGVDLGIDRAAFQRLVFQPARGAPDPPIQACFRGHRDLKELLEEVLPQIGYRGSAEEVLAYWFQKDASINPAMFDGIRALARHPDVGLYIATGQEHRRAAYLWDELAFKTHFRRMFYCAEIGHLKTTPDFFHAINSALGIAHDERPLFFDDDPDVVATARACGWDAVIFDTADDFLWHPRVRELLR